MGLMCLNACVGGSLDERLFLCTQVESSLLDTLVPTKKDGHE